MRRWLLAHPRFVLHFTPTYSSWVNQVERWFAEIQRRCPDRGVFCSLEELTIALAGMDQALERLCPAVQVDQDPRPDHQLDLPVLRPNLTTSSLGSCRHRPAGMTEVSCPDRQGLLPGGSPGLSAALTSARGGRIVTIAIAVRPATCQEVSVKRWHILASLLFIAGAIGLALARRGQRPLPACA